MPERHIDNPITVTGDAELARYCALWASAPLLALDTEFLRVRTYYPIPGLVQLCDGEGIYLLDVPTISDWSPFAALLTETDCPKVMHAASEDLELFQRLLGTQPQPLYDTQIGAALAGLGFSLGYAALVERCIGAIVPKDMARTDWTQRPLSDEQRVYAARDVAYLPEVFRQLHVQLTAQQRMGWWREDCAQMGKQLSTALGPEGLLARIKGAWRLGPRKLAALQQLVVWRENVARERDIPRGFVTKDPQLLEIAQRMPVDRHSLCTIQGVGSSFGRRHGEAVLAILAQVRELPETALPEPLQQPLDRAYAEPLQALRAKVQRLAEDLTLAPEILARRQDCEQLLRSHLAGSATLPDGLRGWRAAVVGEVLLNSLEDAGNALQNVSP